jgi:hypothetical protein
MQAKSIGQLLQSLAVFSACSMKPLVRNANTLLSASRKVAAPVVDYTVKQTFFRHFCGGECIQSIQPTLQVSRLKVQLRRRSYLAHCITARCFDLEAFQQKLCQASNSSFFLDSGMAVF